MLTIKSTNTGADIKWTRFWYSFRSRREYSWRKPRLTSRSRNIWRRWRPSWRVCCLLTMYSLVSMWVSIPRFSLKPQTGHCSPIGHCKSLLFLLTVFILTALNIWFYFSRWLRTPQRNKKNNNTREYYPKFMRIFLHAGGYFKQCKHWVVTKISHTFQGGMPAKTSTQRQHSIEYQSHRLPPPVRHLLTARPTSSCICLLASISPHSLPLKPIERMHQEI